MNETYDLIIIGGSAAATSAGVYAARRGLNFKIITKEFGGEVATSGEIGNWPGNPHTDGLALADNFREHLKSLGVEPETEIEVESVKKQEDGTFCITTKSDGLGMAADKAGIPLHERPSESEEVPVAEADGPLKCDYSSKTVIITTGVHPRELRVPGEKEFRNKGVSYCTTCDGPLFGGKVTAVVGGGNSALESALMLADISAKVYVINKNAEFKGDKVLIDNLMAKKNAEIIYNANTFEIKGDQFVTSLKYESGGEFKELPVEGIFVHIGMVPNSWIVPQEVEKTTFGEIVINANCETSVPGLYAAGDVTNVPFKQIVIAAGQGTIALLSAVQYLNRQK